MKELDISSLLPNLAGYKTTFDEVFILLKEGSYTTEQVIEILGFIVEAGADEFSIEDGRWIRLWWD